MESTVIAIDLAKSVFQVAVSHEPGRVARSLRLGRGKLVEFLATHAASMVLLEACGAAHFWARQAREMGHQVRLLPPHAVRPYVLRDKTDRADAEALLEAHRNEGIRAVPVKSVSRQVLAAHHRVRASWMCRRTAALNGVRSILREQGIDLPQGGRKVVPAVRELIQQEDPRCPVSLRVLLCELCFEIEELEERVEKADEGLERLAGKHPLVQLCRSVPGVGPLTASAILAFVGEVQRFESGRHFASYLGLTPRTRASGLKSHQGRISKRGDRYLRWLLVHGARSVIVHASRYPDDRLRQFALRARQRLPYNKATVAVANKLARVLWSVLRRGKPYQAYPALAH